MNNDRISYYIVIALFGRHKFEKKKANWHRHKTTLTHINRLHNPFYNYHCIWTQVFSFVKRCWEKEPYNRTKKICYWSQWEKFKYSNEKTNKSNNNTRRIIKWFITMDFCGRVNQIYMCTVCVEKRHDQETTVDDDDEEEDENNNNAWTNKGIHKRPSHSQRMRTRAKDTRCHPKWTV